jgi:hypothetical protein
VETYQVLGLVGSLLLVVAIIIPLTFAPYGMYGGTGYPMMGMMGGYCGHPLVFPILFIGIRLMNFTEILTSYDSLLLLKTKLENLKWIPKSPEKRYDFPGVQKTLTSSMTHLWL